MSRIGIALALLVALGAAQDRKAASLAAKAAEIATEAKENWTRLVLEPDKVTDDELDGLIDAYEKAVDLYQESLEIEENPSLHASIVLLAQRLSKLEYERFYREQRRKAAERPKPEPEPEPRPEDPEAEPPEPRPEPEPPPRREEPRVETAPGVPPYPEIFETKKQARQNLQQLRNFIMNDYFAPRKQTALLTRCSVCQGTGRQRTGRLDEHRRPVTIPCGACNNAGYHLNATPARKAYWLTRSPLYRANEANRSAFEAELAAWKADPRTMPEFLKRVRIGDTDYHGLWAKVKLQEIGYDVPTKRNFKRQVEMTLLRIGKRWFLYDDAVDRKLFDAAEGD